MRNQVRSGFANPALPRGPRAQARGGGCPRRSGLGRQRPVCSANSKGCALECADRFPATKFPQFHSRFRASLTRIPGARSREVVPQVSRPDGHRAPHPGRRIVPRSRLTARPPRRHTKLSEDSAPLRSPSSPGPSIGSLSSLHAGSFSRHPHFFSLPFASQHPEETELPSAQQGPTLSPSPRPANRAPVSATQ